jgi:DNA-binding transcriptional LysR family regulator
MDMRTLQLIRLAAEEGSISRAAAREHLALAAASRRIADFEAKTGVKLFERHARGIRLTPAGRVLLTRVQLVLGGMDSLAGAIADLKNGVTEHLSLAACDAAITQFLPRALRDFLADHPRVRVALEERRSNDIVRAVMERQRSVGIVWGDVDARGLVTAPFARDELVLVVPKGHALARRRSVRFIEALAQEFVCLEMESPIYQWLQVEASRLERTLRTRIQVRSFDALCRMVETGLGIGVVPRLTALGFQAAMAISVVGLREPWAHRKLVLVHRGMAELASIERRFVAFCEAAQQQRPP